MNPVDIDRTASAIARAERLIAAPVDKLWKLHTEVSLWPDWQRDIGSALLDRPFGVGQAFTWTTTGLSDPIVSTIYAVDDRRSTLWGGPSAGIDGVHHWMFEANDGGTLATTEESWSGPRVDSDPAAATKMLQRSLERWLDFLAAAAVA